MTFRTLVEECDVRFQGSACTQDSWFPGYAWTIAYCGFCRNHLGWKFTIARANDSATFNMDNDSNDEDETVMSEDDEYTEIGSSQYDDIDENESATEEMTQENSDQGGDEASHSTYFSTQQSQDQGTASVASDNDSFQSANQESATAPSTPSSTIFPSINPEVSSQPQQILQFW